MDSKMLRWNNNNIIKLIKMYEKKCRKWNTGNSIDRIEKSKGIGEIAEVFQCSPDEIERKIRSLKSQYHREKRILHKNSAKNIRTEKVPWFAFNHLRFLDVKQTIVIGAEPQLHYTFNNESNNNVKNEIVIQDIQEVISSDNSHDNEPTTLLIERTAELQRRKSIENTETVENRLIEQPAECSDIKTAPAHNTPRLRDEFDVFGEMVSHRIRNLHNRKRICIVQHAIESAIFQTEMAEFNNDAPS